jgi:hypothetical protein
MSGLVPGKARCSLLGRSALPLCGFPGAPALRAEQRGEIGERSLFPFADSFDCALLVKGAGG